MRKTIEIEVEVCDICGEEKSLITCVICGKVICADCRIGVHGKNVRVTDASIRGSSFCLSHLTKEMKEAFFEERT